MIKSHIKLCMYLRIYAIFLIVLVKWIVWVNISLDMELQQILHSCMRILHRSFCLLVCFCFWIVANTFTTWGIVAIIELLQVWITTLIIRDNVKIKYLSITAFSSNCSSYHFTEGDILRLSCTNTTITNFTRYSLFWTFHPAKPLTDRYAVVAVNGRNDSGNVELIWGKAYVGRSSLSIKDGSGSLTVQNVSINDNGRFDCSVRGQSSQPNRDVRQNITVYGIFHAILFA